MNNRLLIFYFLLFTFYFFCGCMPSPYFQKETAIPKNEWAYNFKPTFTFDITDTTVNYKPSFLIQHTQAYPYCNIWMWIYIKTPGDTILKKERINITLAEATGKWLGRGMGEIWEQRMPIDLGDSVKFNRKGTYQISLEQNMRINPLPDILHIGLRVEKTRRKH
ncbi:MAG: gliding motility lipoprotein GldH [Chitinophagales bacterium]